MDADVYSKLKSYIDNKTFKYCSNGTCTKKTIPSTLVCIHCGELYHLGCLTKDITIIKGNLISCCSSENEEIEAILELKN